MEFFTDLSQVKVEHSITDSRSKLTQELKESIIPRGVSDGSNQKLNTIQLRNLSIKFTFSEKQLNQFIDKSICQFTKYPFQCLISSLDSFCLVTTTALFTQIFTYPGVKILAEFKQTTDVVQRVWEIVPKSHTKITQKEWDSYNQGENCHELNNF